MSMFLGDDLIERDALRQGDIISETHLLGAINLNSINYMIDSNDSKIAWSVSTKPIFGPAMVLSHSCELDKTNGIKVTSVILAPLRNLNGATEPDKIGELIASNYIDENSTASYLKYFYLEAHHLLPQFPSGFIVDFSKIYSVRKQSYESLLGRKIIQLEPDIVKKLTIKLSLYYYRKETA